MQDNILDKFEFEGSRAKVNVRVAIFRNKILSSPLMFEPIFPTNVLYDYILDKLKFEHSKAKVEVTVAVFLENTFTSL